MMETRFTPGPWYLGEIKDYDISGADIYINAPKHDNLASVVWRMECENSSPEKEANARLIAAAPELYEALLDLRASALLLDTVTSLKLRGQISKATEALAKAEGRALTESV